MNENHLENVMSLIATSGNARSLGTEAVAEAKKNNISEAKELIAEAEKFMIEAHKIQTQMLTQEAQGDDFEISLLTIHSQDHLMNTITYIDLSREIIDLYKLVNKENECL